MPHGPTEIEDLSPAQRIPVPGRSRIQMRNVLVCWAALLVSIAAIYPVCNEGYLDDFSYAATALQFARTGHVLYNAWAPATQGWMILWGALFIRLFGFSFNVLRAADVILAALTIWVFYSILIQFGVRSRNAVFGTLALALSPIFLPLATSFMTDVPALLALLLCVYMCQRAVAAASPESAAAWLACAALTNVAAGSVRQTVWLGAAVMVPSTAWLLRKQRRVLAIAFAAVAASLMLITALLHWFQTRPYYSMDPVTKAEGITVPDSPRRLLEEFLKLTLCMLLLALPVLAAWWPQARRMSRAGYLAAAGLLGILALGLWDAARRGRLMVWLAPWLYCTLHRFPRFGPQMVDQLFGSSVTLPQWLAVTLDGVTVIAAVITVEQLLRRRSARFDAAGQSHPPVQAFVWILGPFTAAYLGLLALRAEGPGLSDRYTLALLPFAIAGLLMLYQRFVNDKVPLVSFLVLAVFAFYAVADAHDYYADQRAGDAAVRKLMGIGVPRTAISQSQNSDSWLQASIVGHMHWGGIPGLQEDAPGPLPLGACRTYIAPLTPIVRPRYFVVYTHSPCLEPAPLEPISYRAWLPPFHRREYIEQLPAKAK